MCLLCGTKPFGFSAASLTRRNFVAAALGGLYASAKAIEPAAAKTREAGTAKADILIDNAKVITLDPKRPRAEAIAIVGDRIVGIGSRREMASFKGPATRVIDAGKRTVIPGLNDSHTHFIRGGLTYSQELRWDGVPSLALALAMLKEQALRTPAPHWVQVIGGWTPGQFKEKRLPTLDEINAATGDVPCYVMHIYDRAFLNKAAMRVLGFTKDTANPFGGVLERDPQGNPTGMVVLTTSIASLLAIFARIPKLPAEEQIASTRHFMRELNRLGVTSVIDAGGGGQNYPDNYQAIAKLAADKALTIRVGYCLFAQQPGKELDNYRQWVTQVKPGQGDDFFRMMGAGEYMVWAAHDPPNFNKDVPVPPDSAEQQLAEGIKLVVSNGWPFRLHANYDVTAQRIMRAIETAHRDVPVDKVRWSIDHGETLTPQTLERMAKLGGAVAIQNRMSLDGDGFVAKWGKKAAEDAPPIGLIRKMDLPIYCGTDGNRASSHNPWVGIQWLVTGKTIGGTRLNADRNLVDRTEALRMYSAGGAWATSEEAKKGSLEVGKWADLAVLSADYLGVPDSRISDITAVLTMVGGKVVYGEGPYAGLAPAALTVAPDWLPIGTYPSYRTADLADGGLKLAAGLLSEAMPTVTGQDGSSWIYGCPCGLL
jgi:predicted amidohydrolase YtcJ